jgi:hypothetical protein
VRCFFLNIKYLRGCFLLLLLGCPFGLRNPLNLAAAAAAAAATFNTICHLSSKRSASEDWKQQKKQWFFVIQKQNSRLLGQTIF